MDWAPLRKLQEWFDQLWSKNQKLQRTQSLLHTRHQSLMTITEQVNEDLDAGYEIENSILKYADSRNRCLARSEVKKN